MDSVAKITKVVDDRSIETVAALAHEIWNEYYPSIIGQAQVDYMVKTFQSKSAIKEQIEKENFLYYLICNDSGKDIGYMAAVPKEDTGELFLSKIYIGVDERGKGYAKKAVHFLEGLTRQKNLHKITLMVSKKNKDAIAAYLKMGFDNIGPIITDIGNGFFMDDYKMQKKV